VVTKVLLLEDQITDQQLIRNMLNAIETATFELTITENYHNALSQIAHHDFDVCLVDISLGKSESGLDFIRVVRAQTPNLPMIILTHAHSRTLDIAAMNLGAVDYLHKKTLTTNLLERSLRYAIVHSKTLVKIRELYEQTAELEQLKTDMIRIAAHDLRNPVTTILGSLELAEIYLKDVEADEKTRTSLNKHMRQIKASAQTIHQLVASILSLDKIEELSQGQKQIVNMNALVQSLVIQYEAQAEHANINLQCDLPDSLCHIMGDTAQIREAMSNLINNALKYTSGAGDVMVVLSQKHNQIVFEVRDTGYGVPAKQQSQLFQPFFRAKMDATQEVEGNGLGLYLVKNIVVRHNGKVIFQSVEGEGSTFGFQIPAIDAAVY